MPRKRKAKQTRAAPKLPEGEDEGAAMTAAERRAKLEVILKDFDNEVEARMEMIYKEARNKCAAIANQCRMEMLKLPAHIRKMKLIDFIAMGGSIKNVASSLSGNQQQGVDCTLQSKLEDLTSGHKQNNTKKRIAIEPISEESEAEVTNTMHKRPRRATARSRQTTQMCPPPTGPTRKSMRKKFETPYMKGGMSAAGWETPLITPKFDPRLPMTPGACREAKKGERIMSMAGSPIISKWCEKDVQILLPTAAGETLALRADSKENELSVTKMDAQTIAQMKLIQQKLARMLKN